MIKTKRQYKFGECIPESIKVYNRLKRKGYKPIMVEGWVEIDRNYDILPDEEFLFFFYPDELAKVEQDINYNDYPKILQHTWIEINGHKIDITKNQFDIYGGVKKYFVKETYYRKGNIK